MGEKEKVSMCIAVLLGVAFGSLSKSFNLYELPFNIRKNTYIPRETS